ncbi:MAG: quercetin 2,3-dioxygenase, partial [Casimicrobium sp.]
DESATHDLAAARQAYVHVARGTVTVNGAALSEGDAVMIENESRVTISGGDEAEVLLFDLGQLQ